MAQQQQERVSERVQGSVQALRGRITHFFREVRAEFNKVTWPSRAELTALTVLVLILVVMLSIYLGGLDFGFRFGVEQLLGPGR
jgi:preprotein translocase subunit SecE